MADLQEWAKARYTADTRSTTLQSKEDASCRSNSRLHVVVCHGDPCVRAIERSSRAEGPRDPGGKLRKLSRPGAHVGSRLAPDRYHSEGRQARACRGSGQKFRKPAVPRNGTNRRAEDAAGEDGATRGGCGDDPPMDRRGRAMACRKRPQQQRTIMVGVPQAAPARTAEGENCLLGAYAGRCLHSTEARRKGTQTRSARGQGRLDPPGVLRSPRDCLPRPRRCAALWRMLRPMLTKS